MRRAALLALGLAAACFSEPPTAAEASTGDGSSSEGSGSESGETSTDGTQTSTSSTSTASSTVGTTDEGGCVLEEAQLQGIEADLVIVVDPDTITNTPDWVDVVFNVWDQATHVAFIAPEQLDPGYMVECSAGCSSNGSECDMPTSVLHHYEDPPPPADGGALGLLGPDIDDYACALRPQQPNGAPTRQIVFLTANETTSLPDGVATMLDATNGTFHVACPNCSENNNFNALEEAAFRTFGEIADLGSPQTVALLARAGARRLQCDWPLNAPDDFTEETEVSVFLQASELPNGGVGHELTRVESENDCAGEGDENGPFEFYLDGDRVVLCAIPCDFAQADIFADISAAHEFCG